MAAASCLKQAQGDGGGRRNEVVSWKAEEVGYSPSWAFLAWIVVVLLLGGADAGWTLRGWWCRVTSQGAAQTVTAAVETKKTRSMYMQSQTTYQWHWRGPRFNVVGESMQGAWENIVG